MTLLIGEWSLGLKSMAFVIFTGFVGTKMLLGRKRAGISGRKDVSRSRDDARDLIYCHPSDMLKDVLSIMKERGVVHLPIVDQFHASWVVNARALLVEAGDEELILRDKARFSLGI